MVELIFIEEGKYKSDNRVVVVTSNDVKKKKIIKISGKNADNFVKVGKAVYANAKQPKKEEPKKEIKKEEVKK